MSESERILAMVQRAKEEIMYLPLRRRGITAELLAGTPRAAGPRRLRRADPGQRQIEALRELSRSLRVLGASVSQASLVLSRPARPGAQDDGRSPC